MIEIQNLEFRFQHSDFRLHIPRLTISAGSRTLFVGPSGSGKTTLLNLLAGIYPAGAGRVRIGDADLSAMSDTERRDFRIANVGLVFQEFELIDYLNVIENVLLPYFINRRLKLTPDVRRSAAELAGSMGLAKYLRRPIRQLSHGERQRVSICRALLPNPRMLLADEPTANLDPANKLRIIDLLLEQTAQAGATLIVVTHDQSLLGRFESVVDFAEFG